MTRKDYIAIAEALKIAKQQAYNAISTRNGIEAVDVEHLDLTFDKVIEQLGIVFQLDNQEFDANKFSMRATILL